MLAAQAFVDASGNCGGSRAWVSYSHDGGQHREEEIIPGATAGAGEQRWALPYLDRIQVLGGGLASDLLRPGGSRPAGCSGCT